jgi:8-oxo-dGTP diphosphatase
MPGRRLRYIEFDGQVYLVRRDGLWTFPTSEDELPFEVVERHATQVLGDEVAYCRPALQAFPQEWVYKDDVPHLPDVDPVVRQAVNASLARCVVGLLVVDVAGRVLLVRSNHGFPKGMWNIPGGFIDYGEHPEEAALRELREETGLEVTLGRLLGVYRERFASPYFMYGFMYEAQARSTELRLDPSEIEAAQWMDPRAAYESTRNPFARAAMRSRFGLQVPSA